MTILAGVSGVRSFRPMAVAAAMVGALAATGAAQAQDDDISIYFVGCAAPTGFHGYLARGAAEAGANLGVNVTYIYPDQLTIPNQVQKIEEAIAAQADGIAICVFTEDAAYTDVVARAKEAGIAIGSAAAPPAGKQVRDPPPGNHGGPQLCPLGCQLLHRSQRPPHQDRRQRRLYHRVSRHRLDRTCAGSR